MMFYDYFYCIIMIFLALHLKNATCISNKDINVIKTGVEVINPCSVGVVLYAVVNNTSINKDYNVEIKSDQCCLNTDSKDLCNVLKIEGDCVDVLEGGTTKVLRFVAPLIEPFERHGFCNVYLDSKPITRQRKSMRDKIKIHFDTRLKNLKQPKELVDNVTICPCIDQDPLNDCKPVDCETFYNGKRSFFDNKTKRCIAVPACLSDTNKEVPNSIYDKTKNKCIVGEFITKDDINLIKKLTKKERKRKRKDIIILKNYVTSKPHVDANVSESVSTTDYALKLDPSAKIKYLKRKGLMYIMKKYFMRNSCTFTIFLGVILVQCLLICTMIYCLTKSCANCKKKKVVKKFFNYRQDASVTTPLICTSNIYTDTTEFQYHNERNNVDQMIKCYKACQKERKTQAKISMSDDILSKCLTRRDWKSKPAKSAAITESYQREEERKNEYVSETATNNEYNQRPSINKVNFETEQEYRNKQSKEKTNRLVKITKKAENKNKKDYEDNVKYDLSEKELKCHSYNYVKESGLTGFKRNDSKNLSYLETAKNVPVSLSTTEKGAQAVISNDSLDDFLSERGMMFRGEDLSKYSLSTNSNDIKSSYSSEVSSKTSKNNVVKNVLSLLHRKVSHGPSSHPGAKKKDSSSNVELIHMSKASVYSSYNGSDYLKSLKQTKDSRSSL